MNELLRNLPDYLGGHIVISATALGVGLLISLPLAVLATRRQSLRWPLMTATGVVQTIPSLALLALMYPLMVGVASLLESAGIEISALGFLPAVIALTLYSMLPIVRTRNQQLFKVELPLALPVIIAGVRTATVWVVGIATLADPIGQDCLGTYIFTGLNTYKTGPVLFGCALSAALALILDGLIAQLEVAASRSQPLRGWVAGAGLVLIVVGGLILPTGTKAGKPITIGSKDFTEQFILSHAIMQRLEQHGFGVTLKQGLGSGIVFNALQSGDIDCYVDYSGTVWLNYMNRSGPATREQVLADMTQWLADEHDIKCLGTLGFENTYALAMPRGKAERLGIKTIADLARHAPNLKIGGTLEFFGRPEWQNLRREYGLAFDDEVSMSATLMYAAAAEGDVDVISGFSTDGRIAALDMVVLTDPKQVIPPYDAVLLVGSDFADDDRLLGVLAPLVEAFDAPTMQQANHRVDRDHDKQSPAQAARWLLDQLDFD